MALPNAGLDDLQGPPNYSGLGGQPGTIPTTEQALQLLPANEAQGGLQQQAGRPRAPTKPQGQGPRCDGASAFSGTSLRGITCRREKLACSPAEDTGLDAEGELSKKTWCIRVHPQINTTAPPHWSHQLCPPVQGFWVSVVCRCSHLGTQPSCLQENVFYSTQLLPGSREVAQRGPWIHCRHLDTGWWMSRPHSSPARKSLWDPPKNPLPSKLLQFVLGKPAFTSKAPPLYQTVAPHRGATRAHCVLHSWSSGRWVS